MPKKWHSQTIFVSNHPSAFLDPLVVASLGKPVVHFMTRSDVFKWWLRPITWACHMLPIYRADQDGSGTYDKNKQVFSAAEKVLKKKGNLIMFAEGYTDNVFIRSLKPIKKGPARIAIGTMEACDWDIDLKIQPVGVNYSDPDRMRSDVVIVWGAPIHLKDFKSIYDENPNKAALQLTKLIGKGIQESITYVEDKSKAPFVEELMILSRKGMNARHFDRSIPVIERMNYSHALADRVNEEFTEEAEDWKNLQVKTAAYFNALKKEKVDEEHVYRFNREGDKKRQLKNWLFLIFTFPFFLITSVHHAIPYIITKKAVEAMFKRKVFWSGVKVVLGGAIWAIYTAPVFWLFDAYVYPEIGIENYWLRFAISFVYYWIVPYLTFFFWYYWIRQFKMTTSYNKADSKVLKALSVKRKEVRAAINEMNI